MIGLIHCAAVVDIIELIDFTNVKCCSKLMPWTEVLIVPVGGLSPSILENMNLFAVLERSIC